LAAATEGETGAVVDGGVCCVGERGGCCGCCCIARASQELVASGGEATIKQRVLLEERRQRNEDFDLPLREKADLFIMGKREGEKKFPVQRQSVERDNRFSC
jgi:hypothetical protein